MTQLKTKLLAIGLIAASSALFTTSTQAATVTYDLVKKSALTNVNDAEGRWQFDGGEVYIGNNLVGYYTRKKRVSFGIPPFINKSSMEMTIIWRYGDHNFTVQGSHHFGTGREVGGVSATTPGFAAFENAKYTGSPSSLTINY